MKQKTSRHKPIMETSRAKGRPKRVTVRWSNKSSSNSRETSHREGETALGNSNLNFATNRTSPVNRLKVAKTVIRNLLLMEQLLVNWYVKYLRVMEVHKCLKTSHSATITRLDRVKILKEMDKNG